MNNTKPTHTLEVFDFRRLRQLRHDAGFSIVNLERNVTSNYHGIENGHRLPSITVFSRIAKYLDLDPFSIAIILRSESISAKQYNILKDTAKKLNTSLKHITQEFINALPTS